MFFKDKIFIDDKVIGGKKTFIIAEIGSNHNQDIEIAYKLIDRALESNADAVKFQSIKTEKIYKLDELSNEDRDLLEKISLNEDWYNKINTYCVDNGILFFSAPTYLEAVDLLVKTNVKLIKIASPQTYGFPQIIKKIGETGLSSIMSTGYCSITEIERAINVFKKTGNDKLILLYCVSNYPTSPIRINLGAIKSFHEKFKIITGFSDHTLGYHIALAAVAKGAKVIEKHFTLSRNMNGPDHFFALEPNEFKEMVSHIRDIEESIEEKNIVNLNKFELEIRKDVEMRICAKKIIEEGEKITKSKIFFLRSKNDQGISSWDEENVINKKAKRKINKFEFINLDDIYE